MKQKNPSIFSIRKLPVFHSEYLNELHKKTPETRGTYERTLREFMRWLHNEKSFQFAAEDIERYKRYLFNQKKLTHTSVVMYLTSVRKFCDYLVQQGVMRNNPARGVKGGTPPIRHTRKSIAPEDVQKFLQAIERSAEIGCRDFAMAKLMLGCGLTEIELVRADVEDLQISKKSIRLRIQSKGRKTKDASVDVTGDVSEAVKSYMVFRSNAKGTDPLFMSAGNRTRGERMTSRGIRERINFYLEKSGVKNGEARKITALSLRYTAIKMMAQQGATVDEIKKKFHIVKELTVNRYLEN